MLALCGCRVQLALPRQGIQARTAAAECHVSQFELCQVCYCKPYSGAFACIPRNHTCQGGDHAIISAASRSTRKPAFCGRQHSWTCSIDLQAHIASLRLRATFAVGNLASQRVLEFMSMALFQTLSDSARRANPRSTFVHSFVTA